jgi:hypothetical protein
MATENRLVRYTLDELKGFRDCIGACLDVLEGPDQSTPIERLVDLRQKGVTVTLKAKRQLPLLSPSTPPHASWKNLVELSMCPGLTFQLIDQLVSLMEEEGG